VLVDDFRDDRVPFLFFGPEDEIGVFIRRLNGRVERGRLVNGVFQVID